MQQKRKNKRNERLMMLDRLTTFWKSSRLLTTPPKNNGAESVASAISHNTSPYLETMIKDKPQFHRYQGELTNSWSVQSDTLRYIHSLLAPGMTTLETGCGQTTVVFVIAGAKHTCIMPNLDEAERVKEYCVRLGLKNSPTFIIESSDVALSQSKLVPAELDFVLIDGAHAFPAPILDWYYTAGRLLDF